MGQQTRLIVLSSLLTRVIKHVPQSHASLQSQTLTIIKSKHHNNSFCIQKYFCCFLVRKGVERVLLQYIFLNFFVFLRWGILDGSGSGKWIIKSENYNYSITYRMICRFRQRGIRTMMDVLFFYFRSQAGCVGWREMAMSEASPVCLIQRSGLAGESHSL